MHGSIDGCRFLALGLARQVEIRGAELDPIKFRRAMRSGHVARHQGNVIGSEVERRVAVLIIEEGGAVVVVQGSLLDRDMTRMKTEEGFEDRLTRSVRLVWAGLIG